MAQEEVIFKVKNPNEKDCLETPSIELKKACKAAGIYSQAQELFARWPNLRESSQRLTSLLTKHWPDPLSKEKSLLVECLAKGFNSAKKFEDDDGMEEQIIFIRAIVSELEKCMKTTLMIENGGYWVKHETCAHDYLDGVIKRANIEVLMWIRNPQEDVVTDGIKLIYASRVFTTNELKLAGYL
ncbi:hypothetical protein [Methylomonas sp. AM2-LC]|uniref:hypothetical protein n=1 Tax=Methylomonas sp. AM2-LC TaxID=3153301 RepID=UPI003266156A